MCVPTFDNFLNSIYLSRKKEKKLLNVTAKSGKDQFSRLVSCYDERCIFHNNKSLQGCFREEVFGNTYVGLY